MFIGLSDKNCTLIKNVFSNFPKIEKVIVFGSRASGNYRPGSDIDFAIIGNELDFDYITKINVKLNDLELLYKFDIVNYSTLKNKALIEHIDKYGVLFFEKHPVIRT
jgi:predicted nucleotidyltransferase